MPLLVDTEINITDLNCSYIISSAHRNALPRDKSKWIIGMEEELSCFKNSINNDWNGTYISWGLRINDNNIEIIGINPLREDLKIAKFIDSGKNQIWHGYPADYRRKKQDRPHVNILIKWKDAGIIQKHHIVKIRAGKLCNL